jgi:Fe2+ transport system protein FeoA
LRGHEALAAQWGPLTSLSTGDRVIIRRIHELAEDIPELLTFLEEKRIKPGQSVSVIEILPFNETITLKVETEEVTLGFGIAHQIFVETSENRIMV